MSLGHRLVGKGLIDGDTGNWEAGVWKIAMLGLWGETIHCFFKGGKLTWGVNNFQGGTDPLGHHVIFSNFISKV